MEVLNNNTMYDFDNMKESNFLVNQSNGYQDTTKENLCYTNQAYVLNHTGLLTPPPTPPDFAYNGSNQNIQETFDHGYQDCSHYQQPMLPSSFPIDIKPSFPMHTNFTFANETNNREGFDIQTQQYHQQSQQHPRHQSQHQFHHQSPQQPQQQTPQQPQHQTQQPHHETQQPHQQTPPQEYQQQFFQQQQQMMYSNIHQSPEPYNNCLYQAQNMDGGFTYHNKYQHMNHGHMTRTSHNMLERVRRQNMKSRLSHLRNNIPDLMKHDKAPKIQILLKAIKYIQLLEVTEQNLIADKQLESQKKNILENRLNKLLNNL